MQPRSRNQAILWSALACLGLLAVWLTWRELHKPVPVKASIAIPVVVSAAQAASVPVYLAGLGSVQAYNTVTVHAQVAGILQKVVFVEGQDVKAGDLLA